MASIPPYTFFQCPCANPPSEEDEEGEVDDDDGAATEIATPTSPRTPPPPPLPADASSSSFAFSTSFATDLTGDGSSSVGVGVGAGASSSSAAATAAAFDPRAPRANYSLYPLEHLLYCDDCHQIRCPRCVSEEIVTYFCPSCLFEVPSSNLRTEGNRCTRSCFQCPVCTGPLAVTALEPAPPPDRGLLAAPGGGDPAAAAAALYVLACSYCQWSSSEIGVRFDKPNGIYAQLARVRNGHGNGGLGGGGQRRGGREISSAAISQVPLPEEEPTETTPHHSEAAAAAAELDDDPDMRFAALKAFYSAQMAESAPQAPGALSSLGEYGYSSPSSVQRLMSLYTASRSSLQGGGGGGLRKGARRPPAGMREADSAEEGLRPASLDESAAIDRLLRSCWEDTVSREQAGEQVGAGPRQRHDPSRFRDELRPVPCLLRTKRSKRCPACRHIITKPEAKVSNTRFRIRLVAASYIPTISIRALPASAVPATPGAPAPAPAPQPLSSHPHSLLQPLRSGLYIVKFRNPIFENVRVTLATPAATPGRFPSRVTVLCPQFEIDANTDMWDDALKEEHPRAGGVGQDGGGGGGDDKGSAGRFDDGSRHQVEAGKVWDRGRNWVSIILEVIPAAIGGRPAAELREDEDLLEIPMFVRLEWEYDPQADMVAPPHSRGREGKEKRELAYWCVLGIGRISREETGR